MAFETCSIHTHKSAKRGCMAVRQQKIHHGVQHFSFHSSGSMYVTTQKLLFFTQFFIQATSVYISEEVFCIKETYFFVGGKFLLFTLYEDIQIICIYTLCGLQLRIYLYFLPYRAWTSTCAP